MKVITEGGEGIGLTDPVKFLLLHIVRKSTSLLCQAIVFARKYSKYHIFSNKRRVLNKRRPIITAAPFNTQIKISVAFS